MSIFPASSAHLAKILFDPPLAVFERFMRYGTPPTNGDEKDQPTEKKSQPADDQRHTHSTDRKNPERNSLTRDLTHRNVRALWGVNPLSLVGSN
jgi:hypothetical protein